MPMRYCLVTFCKRQSSFLNLNIGNDSWKKISPRQHLRDTKHTDAHKFSRKLLCRLAPLLVQARELNWKIEANQCYWGIPCWRLQNRQALETRIADELATNINGTQTWATNRIKTIFRLTPTKRYSIWYFAWNFICHVFWHPGMLSDKYSYMHMSQSHRSVNIYILYTILYYTMLCYAMLCYAILCYTILCYTMLCYAMLCYAMLYYTILYYNNIYWVSLGVLLDILSGIWPAFACSSIWQLSGIFQHIPAFLCIAEIFK